MAGFKLEQGPAKQVWLVRADEVPVDGVNPLPVEIITQANDSWLADNTYHHAPAANTAAVVTLTGAAGQSWEIAGIYFSYSEDPTGGSLVINSGGAGDKLAVDQPDGGVGFLPFTPPMRFNPGVTVTVTLAAGGGTATGKLTVLARLV
jgi:hypothetical protein